MLAPLCSFAATLWSLGVVWWTGNRFNQPPFFSSLRPSFVHLSVVAKCVRLYNFFCRGKKPRVYVCVPSIRESSFAHSAGVTIASPCSLRRVRSDVFAPGCADWLEEYICFAHGPYLPREGVPLSRSGAPEVARSLLPNYEGTLRVRLVAKTRPWKRPQAIRVPRQAAGLSDWEVDDVAARAQSLPPARA